MGKAADAARALLPKPLQLFATHMDIVRQITDVVELLRQVEGTPRDAPQSVLYNITEEQLKELELRAGQVGAMVQAMLYIQTYNRDKGTFVDDWTFETIAAVAEQVEQGILTFREARDKREAEQHWKVVQQEIRNEWHKNNPWPHRSPAE